MIVRRTIDKDELKELPKTVFPAKQNGLISPKKVGASRRKVHLQIKDLHLQAEDLHLQARDLYLQPGDATFFRERLRIKLSALSLFKKTNAEASI